MSQEFQPVSAHEIEVPEDHEGRRLDKFLRTKLNGVPKTLIFKLLRTGKMRVNGKKVKAGHRLRAGDEIKVPDIHVETDKPAEIPKRLLRQIEDAIVYEDEDLLVVDKPAGVAVHLGTDVAAGVIEALRELRSDVELVHRLDRDTSGLLMVAKNLPTLRWLQDKLREGGGIGRSYLAVVDGSWPGDVTEVRAPLLRNSRATLVSDRGSPSHTRVTVTRRFGNRATLLRVQLLTGRKHQIRVHTAHEGHPIVGDQRYGRADGERLYLHASELDIPMPDGHRVQLESPWPELARIFE